MSAPSRNSTLERRCMDVEPRSIQRCSDVVCLARQLCIILRSFKNNKKCRHSIFHSIFIILVNYRSKRFFYKNTGTEGSLQMFLLFSILSLKMFLICFFFKILIILIFHGKFGQNSLLERLFGHFTENTPS